MLKPTDINDYFNPQKDKKTFNSVWWCVGGSLLSVGAAITIQMKPDFNIQSVSRVIFSAATLGCGIGIIKNASEIDSKIYFREKHSEGQKIIFDNALTQHVTAQAIADDGFYSQFIPQEEQPQQPQPQPEYEEEYYQPQQPYQPDTNYQEYEEQPQQVESEFVWSSDLLGYPSVLVWGPQGSGKTSFAEWLVAERLKLGHEVIICDPHREYGQWEGLKVVGDGMDYEAIDKELISYTKKIHERYKQRAKTKGYNPQPITIVCDEFTGWADRCEGSADFMAEALTDIRKVNMHALFIAHAKTNAATGGKKGMSKTKEAGLLELELEAKVNPQTRKASPKLKGKLRYPGMADKDRIPVRIAPWMKVSSDFRGLVKQSKHQPQPTEEPDQGDVIDVEVREVVEEVLQKTENFSTLATKGVQPNYFPNFPIATLDDAIALVQHKLKNPDSPPLAEGKTPSQRELLFKALQYHKQNQSDTIYHLFGVIKSGTSSKYKQARDLYFILLVETCDNPQELLPKITSITFPDTNLLPAESGVYFVFDSDFQLYYVGSSNNILLRWNSKFGEHQKQKQVEKIAENKPVKIGWILTSDYKRIESDLVAGFKPLWNGG